MNNADNPFEAKKRSLWNPHWKTVCRSKCQNVPSHLYAGMGFEYFVKIHFLLHFGLPRVKRITPSGYFEQLFVGVILQQQSNRYDLSAAD